MDCPDDLLCTEEEVLQLLSNLDTTKTNGHDDISAIMLKSTALSIAPIITELFNCSITLGKIPTEWKIARVSPIPKQGNSSNPSDYRPISLLSILSKILERHVANILIDHYSNILSSHQWGFTQGKSTSGALVTAIDAWHKLLDSGTEVCAIFFDYRKAFDTVSHTLLLQKLETAGVNIHILTWLHDYLCDRKQYVCVNGSSSEMLPVHSGVPQGSVLGPILFIIFINDVSQVPLSDGSLLTLYADDIMLHRPIYSIDDYESLQNDIDNLYLCSSSISLDFNATKCKYMIISRKKQPTSPLYNLNLNNTPLEKVNEYKYLGIWLTADLNWGKHIEYICSKARKKVGALYRQFYKYSSTNTMLKIYLTCIRPDMEYAVQVWSPYQKGHINALESIQKFALKVCSKQWNADYQSLLRAYKIHTLEKRRDYLNLSFLYNIITGTYSFPNPSPVQFKPTCSLATRSHQYQLLIPTARTSTHLYSFFCATPRAWNLLSEDVVTASNIDLFKKRLLELMNQSLV